MSVDLAGALSAQITTSLAAQAKADELAAETKVKKVAKAVDAAIRGTGQHTTIAISGGAGSILGASLLYAAQHLL